MSWENDSGNEKPRNPFEMLVKTTTDRIARAIEVTKYITGTDISPGGIAKRALDVFVRNDAANPVPIELAHIPLKIPEVYNLTSPVLVSTEFSQALSAGTKEFRIINKSLANELKVGFAVGESGTDFVTIPADGEIRQPNLLLAAQTLFMQTSGSAIRVEILEWT